MTRKLRTIAALILVVGGTALAVTGVRAQGREPLLIVPKKADPNQQISFSFQQADIDDVLRFLADASGKMVFKDSAVSTSVTIKNQSKVSVARAIKLIQFILDLKGYTLSETDEALIVTTKTGAGGKGLGTVTAGRDPAAVPEGKGLITHIIPLISADATRLKEEITPLLAGGGGIITANADTNSLVVFDTADNVRRILQLITVLDRDLKDEIVVKVFRLKFADATEVAKYMTDLFRQDTQQNQQGGNGGGGMGGFPFGGGGMGGMGGGRNAAAAGSGLAALRGRLRFAADVRSNALLVNGAPANIEKIEELIKELDVNLTARTEYRIIPLQYADASALSDQLNQLIDPNAQPGGQRRTGFGGGFSGGAPGGMSAQRVGDQGLQDYRVVPDVRTNSLIVTAPVDGADTLVDLVKKLDVPSQVTSVVRVFQLENAIASEVATTLRNLFQGTTQGGGVGFALFGGGNRTQIPPNSPLDLLRQVTIVANDQTNQLVISGPAQTFKVIAELLSTKQGLDRRLPQVFIEVLIADITLDDETKFGIEWNATNGTSSFGQNFGLTSPTADNTGFRYSVVSGNFQATLQALKSTNRVKVISTPHVLVTDNSPALVSIGERIPYAGTTTVTNGVAQNSVDFQDVSITLNVTPRISPGDNILMDIDQVVNSLIEFINIGQGQTAPRTTNRRAGTTVIVQNDQTVVLGGIISNDQKKTIQKVPILGDLPLVGNLFRNTTKSNTRTELVVFITPHVVREAADADIIRQYERDRLKVDPLKVLDAPFAKPLILSPETLKAARQKATDRYEEHLERKREPEMKP